MITFTATGEALGAEANGFDLSLPLSQNDTASIMEALGTFGVLRFADQDLTPRQLRDFSAHFGELEVNVAGDYQEPGLAEVMTLSNIVVDGKPIGLADAGQDWHTDMSYSKIIAFTNVLYGIEVPHRNGQPLGATQFCNMHAAYDHLPEATKDRLRNMTVLHSFDKFWEKMRREKGSQRPELTPQQRAAKPPVSHPVFLTHPITRRQVLYCNPGYAVRINELPRDESDSVLDFLFEHQLQDRFRYTFNWSPRDVLMWDDIGTVHRAVADYTPDEHRLIKRCQVVATRYYSPDGVID